MNRTKCFGARFFCLFLWLCINVLCAIGECCESVPLDRSGSYVSISINIYITKILACVVQVDALNYARFFCLFLWLCINVLHDIGECCESVPLDRSGSYVSISINLYITKILACVVQVDALNYARFFCLFLWLCINVLHDIGECCKSVPLDRSGSYVSISINIYN